VLLHYLAKHGNCIASLKCCIAVLPDFNQSLLDFFSLIGSQFMLRLLNDSVNLVITGDQLWLLDENDKRM